MKVATKIRITFSVATALLLATGVGAVLLIDHLNKVLSEISFYNLQTEQVADTMTAVRLQPDKTQQHMARLNDLEQWARTEQERAQIKGAREAINRDKSAPQALKQLDQLAAYYRKATVATHDRLTKIHRRATIGTVIVMIDGAVLLLIIMYLVNRWLLNPLQGIRESAARFSEGDYRQLSQRVPSGELADLTSSLDKLGARLKDMSERLERSESLAMVGEACNHVVHTMRSLLTSMRTLAQYERDALEKDANAKAAFEYIIATTDTMDAWARNLGGAVRPMEPKLATQPIEPVIRDSLSLLEPKLTEKRIDVQFEPADFLPNVHLDRQLFSQALVAVITNAIDASHEQGRIMLATKHDSNGTITVVVQDEGAGMTEDVQKRAFDAFFTNKQDSTGLGLTVARRIITLHSGRIEIESERAKGTRVHIHLPSVKEPTKQADTANHH